MYEIEFNASKLSSGVYFYRLQADVFSETKKFMLKNNRGGQSLKKILLISLLNICFMANAADDWVKKTASGQLPLARFGHDLHISVTIKFFVLGEMEVIPVLMLMIPGFMI